MGKESVENDFWSSEGRRTVGNRNREELEEHYNHPNIEAEIKSNS
jgi:hypothetical protein